MAVILRYLTEIGGFEGQLHQNGWSHTNTVCNKNVAKNLVLAIMSFMTSEGGLSHILLKLTDPIIFAA